MTRESKSFRSSFPIDETTFRTSSWSAGVPGAGERIAVFHATTVDALYAAATSEANVLTVHPDDEAASPETRTLADLLVEVETIARALVDRGVRSGDRVLLVLPTSFAFFTTFFAVQRIGAVPVPAYPPASLDRVESGLERIGHIGAHAGVAWCATSEALRPILGDLARRIPTLRLLATTESLVAEGRSSSVRLPDRATLSASSPCFIQYTSGSTGAPKGVLLAHENVLSNLHAMGQALELTRADRVVSWLPLYHDMGLIGGLLAPVYWQMPVALLSPRAFLENPARWLQMITQHEATLSPAPNFAYGLCTRKVRGEAKRTLDLSRWRLALNGAEPVNAKTTAEFAKAFGPCGFDAKAMYPVYGLAEASLAVTFPRPGEKRRSMKVDRAALASGWVERSKFDDDALDVACVGHPIPAHEVVVVDDKGKPLDDEEVGHILVRGPSVMRGYYEEPALTHEVLRDGWLWTGDLGFLGRGGLYVTGRAKDLIILRGKNFYAEDIEREAEGVEGLRPGGVVCFAIYDDAEARDLVVCVCETKLTREDEKERKMLARAVAEGVAARTDLTLDEVVLVAPGSIPKTSSGKRQRSLTRDRYLAGKLVPEVPEAPGRLSLAAVFARSAAGMVTMLTRRVTGRRPTD